MQEYKNPNGLSPCVFIWFLPPDFFLTSAQYVRCARGEVKACLAQTPLASFKTTACVKRARLFMSTASEGSTVAAMELTDEDKRFIVNHEGGITDDVAHEIVESIRVVPNFPKPVSILSPRLHQLPTFPTLFFSVILATSLQFLQLLSSVLVPVSSQPVHCPCWLCSI